ncbi:MAG: hypothetical protein QHJ34_09525 [bacterium]|jgi:hypothetical protein|nr:hypothetical protein [candidate division KSB1 bacterium]MDH7560456.1 hypothetical protein [bacterium]
MTFLGAIRQLCFPRAFRIAASPWPANLEQLLLRLQQTMREGHGSALVEQEPRLLADIASGLWRLRQKMVNPGTNRPLDGMQRPFRHLESVWDALIQAGAQILHHTDKPFDPGMSLKVISFQPAPGLERERVIETIKPTIYFRGRQIHMGEVIVGTPERHETRPGISNDPLEKE